MATSLTSNAISLLMDGSTDLQPILQIVAIDQATRSRYRLTLSDGLHHHETLLPPAHNGLAMSGDLQVGSIVRLNKCKTVFLKHSVSLRLLELEPIQRIAPIVGSPTPFVREQEDVDISGPSVHLSIDTLSHDPSATTPPQATQAKFFTHTTTPFKALTPYQKYWSIEGRALSKTHLREYTTPRGTGKTFGFDLIDCNGDEIHVSAFNDLAVAFHATVKLGTIYTVCNGTVKVPNPAYNHLNSNFEIVLFPASTVEPSLEDDFSIPFHSFHFKTISEINSTPTNSIVDIIGLVSTTSPTSTVRRRDGSETPRKTVALKDMSGFSIDVTLWGEHCHSEIANLSELCSAEMLPVLAIKGCRVVDFNGKTIGTISTTTILVNPDIPETHQLQTWFRESGVQSSSPSLSRKYIGIRNRTHPTKTINELTTMAPSDKAFWAVVHGTAANIDMDDFCFLACPLSFDGFPCMKKVSEKVNNIWHCTKCNGDFPECDYRYILKLQIHDHTGHFENVTAFDEAAAEFVGIQARELHLLSSDPDILHDIFSKVTFRHCLFTVSIKTKIYNGSERIKVVLVKSEELPYYSGSQLLLHEIKNLSAPRSTTSRQL